jgi:hypothetical protein
VGDKRIMSHVALAGPYRVMLPPHRGMGEVSQGGSVAQLAGGALTAATSLTAGILAVIPGMQPVAALVASIGAVLGPLISKFSGCGQTCVVATSDVNQVGAAMTQAFQIYMSAPVHYASVQAAFLSQFDQLMAALQSACSNPSLGAAGQACIADNSPTACKWKASPGGWSQNSDGTWTYTYWGAAGSGNSCWNPYTGIRDMVANDPTVVPDGTAVSGGATTVGSNSTTFATPVAAPAQAASLSAPSGLSPELLLVGALVAFGLWMAA